MRKIATLSLLGSLFVLSETALAQYCILQAPAPFMGPRCFQFFVCSVEAGTMCTSNALGPRSWGPCQVTPLATRSSFAVDPNAHPPGAPTPFLNFEAADAFMKVLSPYGGDWYGCFGAPVRTTLPSRTPPVLDTSTEPGYCLLRKPDLYQPNQEDPPVCFEFYKANAGSGRASIDGGACFVTDLAAREGWEVDPNFGGPYQGPSAWMESEIGMKAVSRYSDDFYGCLEAQGRGVQLFPDTWAWEATCPSGEYKGTYEGGWTNTSPDAQGHFTGSFTSAAHPGSIEGRVTGSAVRFERRWAGRMQVWTGTLAGNKITGSLTDTIHPPCSFTATAR